MVAPQGPEGLELDPLTVFLSLHQRSLPATRAAKRFNAGEHAWLASAGAAGACKQLAEEQAITVDEALFQAIRRRHAPEELQYGELVALSGDFYPSPGALFDEKPARLPWLWEKNDLSDIRSIFAEELGWIEGRLSQQPFRPYPDSNVRFAWNAKSYVELALQNTDHFGWHNMLAYCEHHEAALQLAREAEGRDNETFRRALYTNAFADHFLTDGFAAGHIRVPRAEIISWAERKKLDPKIAGALSKLLHDQDGHVDVHSLHNAAAERDRHSEDGLRVRDATGAEWYTRCDGQLFLEGDLGLPRIERPVLAVQASVYELLLAWTKRELPRGAYQATRFVPYPHPDERPLVDKFSAELPEDSLRALWKSVSWYAKIPWLVGLEREHVRALFESLPEIMAEFRANVARAARMHEGRYEDERVARLEPRYVAAYLTIA